MGLRPYPSRGRTALFGLWAPVCHVAQSLKLANRPITNLDFGLFKPALLHFVGSAYLSTILAYIIFYFLL